MAYKKDQDHWLEVFTVLLKYAAEKGIDMLAYNDHFERAYDFFVATWQVFDGDDDLLEFEEKTKSLNKELVDLFEKFGFKDEKKILHPNCPCN